MDNQENMKPYQYRQTFSGGPSSWNYIEIPDTITKKNIVKYIEENCELSTWSEHFRGVEVRSVKSLPVHVVIEEIDYCERKIKYYQDKLNLKKQLLKKCPKFKGDAKIIHHIQTKPYCCWDVVTVDDKAVYKTAKSPLRDKSRDKSVNWCHQRGYRPCYGKTEII